MASGTIPNQNVSINSVNLGSLPMSAGESMATAEFSFTNPTGYKRYIMDVHMNYTTNTAYLGFTLGYTVDYANLKVQVMGSRPQTTGGINPTITATVIDIPI